MNDLWFGVAQIVGIGFVVWFVINSIDRTWPEFFRGKRWKDQQRQKNGHREPV
jgi:hypothetical protein